MVIFRGKTQYKWPFSIAIAICEITRGYIRNKPVYIYIYMYHFTTQLRHLHSRPCAHAVSSLPLHHDTSSLGVWPSMSRSMAPAVPQYQDGQWVTGSMSMWTSIPKSNEQMDSHHKSTHNSSYIIIETIKIDPCNYHNLEVICALAMTNIAIENHQV